MNADRGGGVSVRHVRRGGRRIESGAKVGKYVCLERGHDIGQEGVL